MIGVGSVISGKYRLLRLLGDGGMGSVYEAQHELLGTRVAIKVLHPDLARRPGLVDRFLQEAKVSAQIKSPHVVHVSDVDRTPEGTAYIVMDLLEGQPLSSVLERDRRLPIPTAVDYTKQILTALEAAHALGVVHRDLKPENVFVTFLSGKPVLKLIDFGIAKLKSTDPSAKSLTVAGVVMGTAEYMAPEQAYGADRADARSDVYAVGVMLYEMIAGERPVSGEDARIIATKVERGEVKPLVHAAPQVPREIAGLVHRAMAARPELRFASATEMRLALEGAPVASDGKRVATRPIAQAASVAPVPPRGTAHDLAAAGPGSTVLGAPIDAVFAPVNDARSVGPMPPQDPRFYGTGPGPAGGTAVGAVQAAPMPSMQPMQQAMPSLPDAYTEAPPVRRRGRGMWLLLILPVLLGVGAAIAYVAGVAQEGGGTPTAATTQATIPPTTPATATTTAAQTAATDTSVAPLNPLTGTATPPATARPRPSGGGTAAPTDTVPTLPFPSAFPSGFPSAFPMPSGFPTAFPTAFPFPPAPGAPAASASSAPPP